MIEYQDAQFEGDIIAVYEMVVNPDDCFNLCTRHEDCIAFTLFGMNCTCYLFSSVTGLRDDPCDVSIFLDPPPTVDPPTTCKYFCKEIVLANKYSSTLI